VPKQTVTGGMLKLKTVCRMCRKVDYMGTYLCTPTLKCTEELSNNKGVVQLLRLQSNLHSITLLFTPSLLSSKIIEIFLE